MVDAIIPLETVLVEVANATDLPELISTTSSSATNSYVGMIDMVSPLVADMPAGFIGTTFGTANPSM